MCEDSYGPIPEGPGLVLSDLKESGLVLSNLKELGLVLFHLIQLKYIEHLLWNNHNLNMD